MASRTARTPLAARFLTAAGVLFVVGVIASFLPFVGGTVQYLAFPLAAVALTIALAMLSTVSTHRIVKPALVIAAVGWAIVALSSFAYFLPSFIGILGALAGAAGWLVAAIITLQNFLLPRRSAIGFLVGSIAGALYLLGLVSLTSFILGVALIVTGVLLGRDE